MVYNTGTGTGPRQKLVKKAEKMALTTAEELRLEGAARAKAESINAVLVTRFGKIPASLKKQINAVHELARLDTLTKLAVSCKTLNDFKKAL